MEQPIQVVNKGKRKEVSRKQHTQPWHPKDNPLGIGSSRVFVAQLITNATSVPDEVRSSAPHETNVEADHFENATA